MQRSFRALGAMTLIILAGASAWAEFRLGPVSPTGFSPVIIRQDKPKKETSLPAPSAKGAYAVVVSATTRADAGWNKAVAALEKKYDGQIIEYTNDLEEALAPLRKAFPRYICFVARPEEAGRAFVKAAHQLTRRLDDDPYADAIWGVLTGYDAQDALRIAQCAKPLAVRKAFSSTVGAKLDGYEEGILFDELQKETVWKKKPGGKPVKESCAQDTTSLIAEALNKYQPDVVLTSGHATERDWMPGFGYRNGRFLCRDGQFYGVDLEKKRHDVDSPNPKIHLAIGNCLWGHVKDRQSLALAMIHSAGVNQLIGYTVSTGYGFGGWGVKDYFSELQAGRFTLAEAHYANQQALLYYLIKAGKVDEPYNRPSSFNLVGDRDTVVLYGDPAWEARMPRRELPWSQKLTERDGVYTFTITANQRGDWDNRPIVHLFPHRVKNVKLIKGAEHKPVITDDFILVPVHDQATPMRGNRGDDPPIQGDFEKGKVIRVRFKAESVE